AELSRWGQPAYRAGQVFRWIHGRGVLDAGKMSDLPKALRERLTASGLAPAASVEHVHRSEDGTRKLVVRLEDGAAYRRPLAVETVLLPARSLDADAAAADH